MKKPRVLLADDHRVVVEGLRSLLDASFDVVGIVSNGRELLSVAKQLDPDVVVLDNSMPFLNGIEAARQMLGAVTKPGSNLETHGLTITSTARRKGQHRE
jgi:DNA-binding NarL/FixJ family response regulator